MKTKLLKLADIVTTAGTQIRARICTDTVDEYATAMQDSANKFPPVIVFHDGTQYILADGFHRVMAATRNGFLDIEAEVNKGTRADALKYALGSNTSHGLKRTNPDKRRCVELALQEWPKLSDVKIADICAVGKTLVGEVRHSLQPVEKTGLETRIGADGKERKMPKRSPAPQSEPVEEIEQPQVRTSDELLSEQLEHNTQVGYTLTNFLMDVSKAINSLAPSQHKAAATILRDKAESLSA